jgi:uncharacterized protein (TIGR03437 family)
MVSVAASGAAYIVPKDTSPGLAGVSVTASDGTTYQGSINVLAIAPRILEVSSELASGYVTRVRGQSQTVEPISRINAGGSWEAVPIDLGQEADQVYLTLFGTGWRSHAESLASINLRFSLNNGTQLFSEQAVYAGAQGEYAGVDQVNFLLPRFLIGKGNELALHTFLMIGTAQTGVPGLVYK